MPNPEGNGGFQDRPEDINRTGEQSKYKDERAILREIGESDKAELDYTITVWKDGEEKSVTKKAKIKSNRDGITLKRMRGANAFIKSFEDIKWYRETMDREEGKPMQKIEQKVDGNLQIKFDSNDEKVL